MFPIWCIGLVSYSVSRISSLDSSVAATDSPSGLFILLFLFVLRGPSLIPIMLSGLKLHSYLRKLIPISKSWSSSSSSHSRSS